MKKTNNVGTENNDLGLNSEIDRRDFVGMMLAGATVAASPGLAGCISKEHEFAQLRDATGWTLTPDEFNGFGSSGEYAGRIGRRPNCEDSLVARFFLRSVTTA